jgi:hypothetical protein
MGQTLSFHPTIYFDSLQVEWSQEEQDTGRSDMDSELESGEDYKFNTEDGLCYEDIIQEAKLWLSSVECLST